MGDLIQLTGHPRFRAAEPAGDDRVIEAPDVVFAFDLASPFTYLAAERVERRFGRAVWLPVLEEAAGLPPLPAALAEERAAALGLPLAWPEGAGSSRAAMRVASLAAECGRAPAFVLAASRLAFCGGFELDDPEVIAEAAAIAQIGLEEALAAAGDASRDEPMQEAARRLVAAGADRLPAVEVDGTVFAGEDGIAGAAVALRAGACRPLRHVAP